MGMKLVAFPVSYGDGTCLIEEHHINVTGQLHRLAALRNDVGLQGPIHPRNADSGEQGADGGRYKANQERNQGRNVGTRLRNGS